MLSPYSLFFLSCGYKVTHLEEPSKACLTIPYVKGDALGAFTADLIEAFHHSALFSYSSNKGAYRIEATLLPSRYEEIGYRQKTEKEGQGLIVTEGRTLATVEVRLIEEKTKRCSLGPYTVSCFIDYDFFNPDSLQDLSVKTSSGSLEGVVTFSLGQLEGIDTAEMQAKLCLYRQLAQKVVDVISAEWYNVE